MTLTTGAEGSVQFSTVKFYKLAWPFPSATLSHNLTCFFTYPSALHVLITQQGLALRCVRLPSPH
jgi:hypothetical protein